MLSSKFLRTWVWVVLLSVLVVSLILICSNNITRPKLIITTLGAAVGIGIVFAALLQGTARNPALRGQLFSYAILGFAFVEAMGLFDLMIAMMCKYV